MGLGERSGIDNEVSSDPEAARSWFLPSLFLLSIVLALAVEFATFL